ncbi:MAG: septum formation initiator family protein [Candidatus Acidiferrales bacterium]
MDQPVKPAGSHQPDPVRVNGAQDEQLPFFEHLVAFFRRNALYFLIIGLVLLIVQDVFGTHGVLAMRRSQVEAQQIRTEIKKLDDENSKLQNDAKDLKSDPGTIEGQARAIGLARPGEVVFHLQQKSADVAHSAPATPAPKN